MCIRDRNKLQHLEIDRNYFALILIENNQGEINQQQLALMLGTDKVSIVPVSYTHLDVYKRQTVTCKTIKAYFADNTGG